jgi:hypothetical protein
MSIADLDRFWTRRILTANFRNISSKIRRQFTPHKSVRRINSYGLMMAVRYLKGLLAFPFRGKTGRFRGMQPPPWYDT